MFWSGGRDSTLCLDALRRDGQPGVDVLVTSLDAPQQMVAGHGVRRDIVEAQAKLLDLPLVTIDLPAYPKNDLYIERTRHVLGQLKSGGITHVAFGDIFQAEIRRFREDLLTPLSLEPLFPLWGADSKMLPSHFLQSGYRAMCCAVDPDKLDLHFAGRPFNATFLMDLPQDVDPSGENGEFHSLVTAGPPFREPLKLMVGALTLHHGTAFRDIRLFNESELAAYPRSILTEP